MVFMIEDDTGLPYLTGGVPGRSIHGGVRLWQCEKPCKMLA